MPWRLIFVVILMGIVLFFVGFNIENRADISFGFHVFHQIPIFISLFVAFLSGILVTLPFTFGFRHRKKMKNKLNKEADTKKGKLSRAERKKNKESGSPVAEHGEMSSGPEVKKG